MSHGRPPALCGGRVRCSLHAWCCRQAVLDRLRYCDRRHAQLQRRGDELAEAEARLNERLEGVKSKILAERAKMSRAF